MHLRAQPIATASSDDRTTIVAISVLAFIVADMAHETLGHGIGYFLGGGTTGVFTTTRIIPDHWLSGYHADIFDLGGPAGNLLFAACPSLAQRLLRRPALRLRLFLFLLMAYSLFWAFGYLIFCGVVARGDWFALIREASPLWVWRVLFVIVGMVLYRLSMRLVAADLHWVISKEDPDGRFRLRRLILLSYISGGLIACAGAALDPYGWKEILNSGALAGFAAPVGLLWMPALFPRSGQEHATATGAISRSFAWILAAFLASVFFIAVLGPGIKFHW
jgi:hypothetical protein